jgi:hypothetical protein
MYMYKAHCVAATVRLAFLFPGLLQSLVNASPSHYIRTA